MFEQNTPFQFLFAPPPFPGVQSELLTEKIELSSPDKKEGEIDSIIFTFDQDNESVVALEKNTKTPSFSFPHRKFSLK